MIALQQNLSNLPKNWKKGKKVARYISNNSKTNQATSPRPLPVRLTKRKRGNVVGEKYDSSGDVSTSNEVEPPR